jgi:hypothetical protein
MPPLFPDVIFESERMTEQLDPCQLIARGRLVDGGVCSGCDGIPVC